MSAFGGKAAVAIALRMLLMVQKNILFRAYMSRGIGALYGWLEKGAHHGARRQYFSNHFSRSSDGDGLRRLGHVQESFVTASKCLFQYCGQSGHDLLQRNVRYWHKADIEHGCAGGTRRFALKMVVKCFSFHRPGLSLLILEKDAHAHDLNDGSPS